MYHSTRGGLTSCEFYCETCNMDFDSNDDRECPRCGKTPILNKPLKEAKAIAEHTKELLSISSSTMLVSPSSKMVANCLIPLSGLSPTLLEAIANTERIAVLWNEPVLFRMSTEDIQKGAVARMEYENDTMKEANIKLEKEIGRVQGINAMYESQELIREMIAAFKAYDGMPDEAFGDLVERILSKIKKGD